MERTRTSRDRTMVVGDTEKNICTIGEKIMSKKESNPMPEGLVKPAPPPAPPTKCGVFKLNDDLFIDGMRNVSDACEEIMKSNKSTIEAKTGALNLQIAALRMKVLILEEGFWK